VVPPSPRTEPPRFDPRLARLKSRLLAVALVLLAAAFQFPGAMKLGAADPLISAAAYRGFFPPEDGLRWSAARSAIVFPEPGPGIPVRVELLLSGWRPPGVAAPRVVVTAGGRSVSAQPGPGAEVVALETTTSGWWRSDLEVELSSDVFDPGPGDTRRLGVRVEEARLIPLSRGLRIPPLGPLAGAAASALLIALVLGRAGSLPRTANRAALGFVVIAAAGFTFARPWAGLLWAPLAASLVVLGALTLVLPGAAKRAGSTVGASVPALLTGLHRLKDPHLATLFVSAVILLGVAYRTPSRIDIDLGSGREVAVARDFGSFVGRSGVTARWAPRGAHLDLSDFGGGAPWRIEVAAAVDGPPRDVAVLGVSGRELIAPLEASKWTSAATSFASPFGWRSGLVVSVPGGFEKLRIDRISIERGAALPSIRVVVLVVCGALIVMVGAGVLGLSRIAGRAGAAAIVLGSSLAIASEPLAAIPFLSRFAAILSAGLLLAAILAGIVTSLKRHAWLPGPVAMGAAASGWVAWLTATAFPYYRGGHFVFHSSIAEEIWKGRFLLYYLPFPGSMLSEQAQWGKIVIPHPALYQTLVAPLAALPKPWFHFAEKALLALFFASLVLMASIVAQRLLGARAGAFAAIVFAGLVPGFQLLGLGHLMTILGVWASSLALSWLIFNIDELPRFKTWLATAWIFTFCFLSYTASLLFTGMVLVFLIAVSARAHPFRARSVSTMLLAASTFAFLLYYVHWTAPFLLHSAPKILGGAGLGGTAAEASPILFRLSLEPGKLTYSYGSMLIPVLGALGLRLLPKSWDRLVLGTWMGILFLVSALDVFFNFLLKHHYYVMLPVAVGLGALLARVEERGGRLLAAAMTLLIVIPGMMTAIDVALGRIP
jgi:hypothetical protein